MLSTALTCTLFLAAPAEPSRFGLALHAEAIEQAPAPAPKADLGFHADGFFSSIFDFFGDVLCGIVALPTCLGATAIAAVVVIVALILHPTKSTHGIAGTAAGVFRFG